MYVCVCNAVTDREIRQCVALGAETFEQVRDCLGVSSCCGRCEPVAREIVIERHTAPALAA
jgi:bacterioferritin-associated ferredoxin